MTPPVDHVTRPSVPADIDDVVTLLQAWDLEDSGRVDPVREHVEEFYASSLVDLARDSLVVASPSGELVAVAQLFAVDPTRFIDAFVRVHPHHLGRGFGTMCRRWSEAAAAARIPVGSTTQLLNATTATDEAGIALLIEAGYEQVRTFWHMHRMLDGVRASDALPEGVVIAGARRGVDDRTIHRLTESSFHGHFGWEALTFEQWQREVADASHYDPGLVLIASVGGEPVGLLQAREMVGPAFIDIVGVLPAFRGRGIGRALLLRSFVDLAARGYEAVMLNVDAGNETGATRLYEGVGMAVYREWRIMGARILGTAPAG